MTNMEKQTHTHMIMLSSTDGNSPSLITMTPFSLNETLIYTLKSSKGDKTELEITVMTNSKYEKSLKRRKQVN